MVQSVELVPGPQVEATVRAQWRALADAGLPSLAHHTGATNRPHVTLTVARAAEPRHEEALAEALADGSWQVPLRVGAVVLFGPHGRHERYVLVRLVVPTAPLLALHAAVHAAWADATDVPATALPGAWTPHLTLARHLPTADVPRALAALGVAGVPAAAEPAAAEPARGVRRWDGEAREERWVVGG